MDRKEVILYVLLGVLLVGMLYVIYALSQLKQNSDVNKIKEQFDLSQQKQNDELLLKITKDSGELKLGINRDIGSLKDELTTRVAKENAELRITLSKNISENNEKLNKDINSFKDGLNKQIKDRNLIYTGEILIIEMENVV